MCLGPLPLSQARLPGVLQVEQHDEADAAGHRQVMVKAKVAFGHEWPVEHPIFEGLVKNLKATFGYGAAGARY